MQRRWNIERNFNKQSFSLSAQLAHTMVISHRAPFQEQVLCLYSFRQLRGGQRCFLSLDCFQLKKDNPHAEETQWEWQILLTYTRFA